MKHPNGQYLVIGGVPVRLYTGGYGFTNLRIVYRGDDVEEAKAIVKKEFDECGGLMLAIDLETGEQI